MDSEKVCSVSKTGDPYGRIIAYLHIFCIEEKL
jgi:hypothetical protein